MLQGEITEDRAARVARLTTRAQANPQDAASFLETPHR